MERHPGRPRRVVIIGGGFGGLTAAHALRRAAVEIVLIDRTNHHLFQPLLYQVATAALSPNDIASPLRTILRGQDNVTVLMAEAREIDRALRVVRLADGRDIPFDALIVAPGTRHSYFGHPEWETFAPGLKTVADALRIRERILMSFEQAAVLDDPREAEPWLTFVVVGGGPTGVELAGAMAEIAFRGLLPDFPMLRREQLRIILLEGSGRILGGFSERLAARGLAMLAQLGVDVRLHAAVTGVTEKGVTVGDRVIETRNVIWAPGNVAPALLRTLHAPLGPHGHVHVRPDLTIEGEPFVFVIGDAAVCDDETGQPLPALAPVAMQQARYVARLIADARPPETRAPFRYVDRGTMATIGKARAIAQIGPIRTAGVFAWLLWSVVHIFFLIGFRNRVRVMLEWMWYYVTFRPGARIIYSRASGGGQRRSGS